MVGFIINHWLDGYLLMVRWLYTITMTIVGYCYTHNYIHINTINSGIVIVVVYNHLTMTTTITHNY
jgi:hypothetical protein